ncbi:MAG: sodium:proton antiporter [Lachnospiraceae bacterium]|nr:sodium:proton antiporter [Lachnospiraceae bacterium]
MELFKVFLLFSMVVMAILIIVAGIRSVIGPKTSDRIIAVNMIGTLTISLIAMLSIYMAEDYLVDVCLIYAMISFLAVVILTKVYTGIYLQKKQMKAGPEAIADNLATQSGVRETDRKIGVSPTQEEKE